MQNKSDRKIGVQTEPISVHSEGLTLRGDWWRGSGQGPTVLLAHGGGQTRHSWDSTARSLAEAGWDCLSIDLRGHGESGWAPDGDYSVDAHARDITAAAATVETAPILVGASLGGLSALAAQAADPGVGQALVLVDVVPRVAAKGAARIVSFMTAHLDGFSSLEEVGEAVSEYTNRKRPTNLEGLKKNVRLREDGRWYWHWDPRMLSDPRETSRNVDPDRLIQAACSVTVPVALVRGTQSDIVNDEGIGELTAALPDCRVYDVPNAGHMVAGDNNDVFADRIMSFLATAGIAS